MADNDRDAVNESIPMGGLETIQLDSRLEFVGQVEARGKLFGELAAAVAEFDSVAADSEGMIGNRKFKYSDLGTLRKATVPHLSRHGIVVLQLMTGPHTLVAANSGEAVEVHRLTTLIAGHGAEIHTHMDYRKANDLKGWGMQTTYLRRYAYRSIFGLDATDDADSEPMPADNGPRRNANPAPPHVARNNAAVNEMSKPARNAEPAHPAAGQLSGQQSRQQAPQAAQLGQGQPAQTNVTQSTPRPASAPPPAQPARMPETPPSAQQKPASSPPPPPAPAAADAAPTSFEDLMKAILPLFKALGYKGKDGSAEKRCMDVTGKASADLELDDAMKLYAALKLEHDKVQAASGGNTNVH